jgi:hypothetical protein
VSHHNYKTLFPFSPTCLLSSVPIKSYQAFCTIMLQIMKRYHKKLSFIEKIDSLSVASAFRNFSTVDKDRENRFLYACVPRLLTSHVLRSADEVRLTL